MFAQVTSNFHFMKYDFNFSLIFWMYVINHKLYLGFHFFSRPVLAWYYLVGIGLLNALGYIIFRASETQRCEFAKDPSSAKPEGNF